MNRFTPFLLLFGSSAAGVDRAPAVEPDADCAPGQVQVLMLGTFHFAQQEVLDVLDPGRQAELVTMLRPWYDRNMRIVQNFLRVLDDGDDRLFLVIGGSHLPVLRHLVDMTPQLCSVDPLRFLP